MITMDYGYSRCSTDESRQDIDRQWHELKQRGIKDENIYWEYVSGSKDTKIEWNRLLSVVSPMDSIACTEVSRLTRSTKQLCEIIKFARSKQIKLIIGTFVWIVQARRARPYDSGHDYDVGSLRRNGKVHYLSES
ncbi:MAG: site-specific recombinase, invertase Pin [Anaerocolumna sp.]|nr:site-specific recombinase, invertase Pin [Clostridia bacterium]MDF2951021.1 site-specific recombinase, invertase Pin [Anaerocolumna sp.]